MKAKRFAAGMLAAGLLLPLEAGAFSFLPGGFAAGEKILSMQLSAGSSGGPTVTFNTATNDMTFQASVSSIVTNVTTYSIPLDTVLFDSQIELVSETVLAPFPPFFGGQITASLTNGLVSDLTITDVGPGGSGLLLAADYDSALAFQADTPGGFGFPVTGSLNGDFTVLPGAGDANFEGAFRPQGNYFANLTNFVSNGTPVTTDLCGLITPVCASGQQLDSFTVNPTATIISIPEPRLALLLVIAAAALAVRRGAR